MDMRTVTNELMELVDGAGFDYARHVLLCALKYMSEAEVADMARINELMETKEEREEEEPNEGGPKMKRHSATVIVTETSTYEVQFDAPEHADMDELDELAREEWLSRTYFSRDYEREIEVELADEDAGSDQNPIAIMHAFALKNFGGNHE
jgi:hypothetical protein